MSASGFVSLSLRRRSLRTAPGVPRVADKVETAEPLDREDLPRADELDGLIDPARHDGFPSGPA